MKIRDDDSSGKMRAMLKDFSKIVNPPLEDKRPQRLRKDWKNIACNIVCKDMKRGEDATERVFSLGDDKSAWLTGLSHFPAGLAAWLLTMMALNM